MGADQNLDQIAQLFGNQSNFVFSSTPCCQMVQSITLFVQNPEGYQPSASQTGSAMKWESLKKKKRSIRSLNIFLIFLYFQHSLLSDGPVHNIVCTEPRRISAISLANRVSQEMGEAGPGGDQSLIGYQIRSV